MMTEDRFDLREIARAVLNDLPQDQRLALMTEMMVEASGDRVLEFLSTARAAISLRMQELIEKRFPSSGLAEIYAEHDAHARVNWRDGQPHWVRPTLREGQREAIEKSYADANLPVPDALREALDDQASQAARTGKPRAFLMRREDAPDVVAAIRGFLRNPDPLAGDQI